MKKYFLSLMVVVFLGLLLVSPVIAANEFWFTVNGKEVPSYVHFVYSQGKVTGTVTVAELRSVLEETRNSTITWDGLLRMATATKGDDTYKIFIDDGVIRKTAAGQEQIFYYEQGSENRPRIDVDQGRIYVSIDFLKQVFDFKVAE